MTDMGGWSPTLRGCYERLTSQATDRHESAVAVLRAVDDFDRYRQAKGLTRVEFAELFEALYDFDQAGLRPVPGVAAQPEPDAPLPAVCLGPYRHPATCLTAWASDHNPERVVLCESCRQAVMDALEGHHLPWSPQWYDLAGLSTRAGAPS